MFQMLETTCDLPRGITLLYHRDLSVQQTQRKIKFKGAKYLTGQIPKGPKQRKTDEPWSHTVRPQVAHSSLQRRKSF